MILVVDDSPLVRSFVMTVLERMHCQVCEATNAAAARTICALRHLEAIFLDIELPDASGLAVYQQVRSLDLHHETPIVFMSGHSIERVVTSLVQLHDVHFLPKPFTIAQLQSLIHSIVAENHIEHNV